MLDLCRLIFGIASDLLRSRVALEAEILVLRQQINVLRRANPPPHQIFGHAGLADIDAKLEKLAMDPRCSPQRIGAAHLPDKLAYFYRRGWSSAALHRFSSPIRS